MKLNNLREISYRVRKNVLQMAHNGKSSHVGSALSIVDILVTLYFGVFNNDLIMKKNKLRDKFILSKGHAGSALYAILYEIGLISKEELFTHCKDNSRLSGHVSHLLPGIEISTGSLGHGLSIGCGFALAKKMNNKKIDKKVYVLLSDGECDEGSTWEAVLFASHHKLNNLICLIDYNKLQSLDKVKNTLNLEPFKSKWKSFGWDVVSVDGHNHNKIIKSLKVKKKPLCIICNTTKGKGVKFMQDKVLWHYRSPNKQELAKAIKSLK